MACSCEAHRPETDAPADERRSPRSPRSSLASTGSAAADQLLGADRRAVTEHMQPRTESVAAFLAVDEPELGQRPQVAVDRRERGVEQDAELVGADLASIGDGQEHAQPAGERRVLGGFFGRAVSGRITRFSEAAGRSGYRRTISGRFMTRRVRYRRLRIACRRRRYWRREDHRHPAAASARAPRPAVPCRMGPGPADVVRR